MKWARRLFGVFILSAFLACFGTSQRAEAATQTLTLNPSALYEYDGGQYGATRTQTTGDFWSLSVSPGGTKYIYLRQIHLGVTIPANSLVYFPVRYVGENFNFAPFTTSNGLTIENQDCFQPQESQIYCVYWLRTTTSAVTNPTLFTRTLRPDVGSFNIQLPPTVSAIDLGEDTSTTLQNIENNAETQTSGALGTGSSGATSGGAAAEQGGQSLLSAVTTFVSALTTATATDCVLPSARFNDQFSLPAIDFCSLTPPPAIMAMAGLASFGAIIFVSIGLCRKIWSIYNEIIGR